jgi:predicted lipoprotein with Yx(FWY)xxD motif
MDRRTLLRNVTACGSSIFLGSLAGCAGNSGSDSATTTTSTPTTTESGSTPTTTTTTTATEGDGNTKTTASATATVVVSSTEKFGDILTDNKGVTLYLFTKDKPEKSVCYDGCATNWPPLTIGGKPNSLKAGPEVTAQLDTIQRKNGSMQVTVADHPLYYYAGDEKPGDTNGQGLGGVWFVVGPDGQKRVKTQTATPTTTTTTEDSGGYGGY